jgi:hypothetical protein
LSPSRYWTTVPEWLEPFYGVPDSGIGYSQNRNRTGNRSGNRSGNDSITGTETNNFDQFWTIYPKKVGKPKAVKAFSKAITELAKQHADPVDWLLKRVAIYSKEWEGRPDRQFCPHPATWLNDERYNDITDPKPTESIYREFKSAKALP